MDRHASLSQNMSIRQLEYQRGQNASYGGGIVVKITMHGKGDECDHTKEPVQSCMEIDLWLAPIKPVAYQ